MHPYKPHNTFNLLIDSQVFKHRILNLITFQGYRKCDFSQFSLSHVFNSFPTFFSFFLPDLLIKTHFSLLLMHFSLSCSHRDLLLLFSCYCVDFFNESSFLESYLLNSTLTDSLPSLSLSSNCYPQSLSPTLFLVSRCCRIAILSPLADSLLHFSHLRTLYYIFRFSISYACLTVEIALLISHYV